MMLAPSSVMTTILPLDLSSIAGTVIHPGRSALALELGFQLWLFLYLVRQVPSNDGRNGCDHAEDDSCNDGLLQGCHPCRFEQIELTWVVATRVSPVPERPTYPPGFVQWQLSLPWSVLA